MKEVLVNLAYVNRTILNVKVGPKMDRFRQVSLCIAINFCQSQQHVTFSQTKVNTKLIS